MAKKTGFSMPNVHLSNVTDWFRQAKRKLPYRQTVRTVQKHPLTSFFISLAILFGLIFLANVIGNPSAQTATTQPLTKDVQVYRIGVAPKVTLQAKIEKSGTIQIVAQTNGIINDINVNEGDSVGQGTTLLDLASNYQGADALGIQAQIANTTNKNVQDTYTQQVNIINKNSDIANTSATNATDLQNIAQKSVNDTQSIIDQNNSFISTLQAELDQAQQAPNPTPGATDALQGQINGIKASQAQLQNQLRQNQLQANPTGSAATLSNQQKDVTLMQLAIQQKTLDLNKEISSLQANLASVNDSIMHPASPFPATVDRVYVKIGQSVTPGTPLFSLSADDPHAKAIVNAPGNITDAITNAKYEPSIMHLNNKKLQIFPAYVSKDATDGQLHSIIFNIPDDYYAKLTDGDYITVDMPIGYPDTDGVVPFVPVDAVYQTQENAYVFVVEKGKAVSRTLTLGQVYGGDTQVLSGLKKGDQLILNRDIVNADPVKITN